MQIYTATFNHAIEYKKADGTISYITSTKQYRSLCELLTALAAQASIIPDPRDIRFHVYTIQEKESQTTVEPL